jgi:hypothetical protein
MLVKQTRKPSHTEPIYFVELASTPQSTALVTNTASDSGAIGPDGFQVQYQQRINLTSGACTCSCKGFQESIAPRAAKDCAVPSIDNNRQCKHIRKAAAVGREWGYIEEKPVFDYVAFFESD